MTGVPLFARDRYWLQIVVVAFAAMAFVLLTDALAFRSLINISWMVGLPILMALVANTEWGRRCAMMIVLVLVSLGVSMVIGVNFTSYG
jgi:hypothetical protein